MNTCRIKIKEVFYIHLKGIRAVKIFILILWRQERFKWNFVEGSFKNILNLNKMLKFWIFFFFLISSMKIYICSNFRLISFTYFRGIQHLVLNRQNKLFGYLKSSIFAILIKTPKKTKFTFKKILKIPNKINLKGPLKLKLSKNIKSH